MSLIAVLDLGSAKAVCLTAEPVDSAMPKVTSLSFADCNGLKKGQVIDEALTTAAVAEVIRDAENKTGQTLDDFVVSIGGSHIEGSDGQGLVPIYPRCREITREDVLQVVNHSRQVAIPAGREILHALPREFQVDGTCCAYRPIGLTGGRLEVFTHIVTGDAGQIDAVTRAVEGAGKRVGQLVSGALASGLGVLSDGETETGAAVVDIGAGKTDVAVFRNGSVCALASIPIGSGLVTNDLANLLKTSTETAESLKKKFGSALAGAVPEQERIDVLQLGQVEARPMQRHVFCEIIESRMRELANHVGHVLQRDNVRPSRVVITGGGSQIQETKRLFEEIMPGTSIRIGLPTAPLPALPMNGPPSASFAASVGLARFACQGEEDELAPAVGGNLMNKVRTLWSMFERKS